MDVVKVQLERIRQQLAGLTATQRMLAGTLVAIIVLTMMYMGKYAGSPEMVPVLDQSLNEDDIGRIDLALEAQGVPHSVSAGKILVPADRKMEIVANLMFQQQLPRDSQSAFEKMSKELNMFATPTQTDAAYNQATQMTLAQLIRRFPNVADATVIINPKSERRVENSIVPTATVSVSLRDPTQSAKQLITAAADGVSGAVAGLTRGHVSVIINGRSHHVPDIDANAPASGDDLMDRKREAEEMEEQKILAQFSYIPGIAATVTCDVDPHATTEVKHTVDSVISKPAEEKEHTEENNSAPAPASDPGVGANTGASIATASGGGTQTNNVTENDTKNSILPSTTDIDTRSGAGVVSVRSATVRVPRSYFVSILKHGDVAAKEPDDAAVEALAKSQLASITDGVKTCIGLTAATAALSVDMYLDVPMGSTLAMAAGPSSTPGTSLGSVTVYGKEIAVGVLAVVSLFMMSSMVKKSTPAPVLAAPVVDDTPAILMAGEGLAGEAGGTNATLAGMELDDDAVQAQQMLDQVTTMVKENPDGAAALVKRWLNRS